MCAFTGEKMSLLVVISSFVSGKQRLPACMCVQVLGTPEYGRLAFESAGKKRNRRSDRLRTFSARADTVLETSCPFRNPRLCQTREEALLALRFCILCSATIGRLVQLVRAIGSRGRVRNRLANMPSSRSSVSSA